MQAGGLLVRPPDIATTNSGDDSAVASGRIPAKGRAEAEVDALGVWPLWDRVDGFLIPLDRATARSEREPEKQ